MSPLYKLLLCVYCFIPFAYSSKAYPTEPYDETLYETYKAQSLIPLDEMSRPD